MENVVADHLSRLTSEVREANNLPIRESFPDEQLMAVQSLPWYTDIMNYLATCKVPDWPRHERNRFFTLEKNYFYNDPYLYKYCADYIYRRCVPAEEAKLIIYACHEAACGVTFHLERQPTRFCKVVSTGHNFLLM